MRGNCILEEEKKPPNIKTVLKALLFSCLCIPFDCYSQEWKPAYLLEQNIIEIKVYKAEITNSDKRLSARILVNDRGLVFQKNEFFYNDEDGTTDTTSTFFSFDKQNRVTSLKTIAFGKVYTMDHLYTDSNSAKIVINNDGNISEFTSRWERLSTATKEIFKEYRDNALHYKSIWLKTGNTRAGTIYERRKGKLQLKEEIIQNLDSHNNIIHSKSTSFMLKGNCENYGTTVDLNYNSNNELIKRCYTYSCFSNTNYCEFFEYIRK